jgi:hypothetical protein
MLPDLVSMLKSRVPRLEPGLVADGVTLHLLTDDAFHHSRAFRELSRRAFTVLLDRGVRRGPARAAAHVGVELLIDTALAWSLQNAANFGAGDRLPFEHAPRNYYRALRLGSLPLPTAKFERPEDAACFMQLCRRLAHAGVQRFRVTPHQAMRHLARALQGRPRIQMSADEELTVRKWAVAAFPSVELALPRLLKELEMTLGLALTGPAQSSKPAPP